MEALTTYLLIAAAFIFGCGLLAKAVLGIKRSLTSTSDVPSSLDREGN